MKLAIQTSRLPGTSLLERLRNAGRFGFDGVEVTVGPDFDLGEHQNEVRGASLASGLPISGICTHSMHDPLMPNPAERATRLAGLANLLRLAGELGADGVVSVPVRRAITFPNIQDTERELEDLAVSEFSRWVATLAEGTAAVFLEPLNRYEATFLRRIDQAADIAGKIGSPRIRALADLFHMNIEEADMAEPIRTAAGNLGYVHIADNNRLQPGAGCLDFRTPFRALKDIGYAGWVSIECTGFGGPLAERGLEAMLPATVEFVRTEWEQA